MTSAWPLCPKDFRERDRTLKITFVYPDLEPQVLDWAGHFYHGIAILSAVLKQQGHHTSLIHITQPVQKDDLIERIRKEACELIGFSSTSHISGQFQAIPRVTSCLETAANQSMFFFNRLYPATLFGYRRHRLLPKIETSTQNNLVCSKIS